MNVSDHFYAKKISPFFALIVDESSSEFDLSDKDEAEIDRIWQQQLELSGGKLFNGKMLNFMSYFQERMVGQFIDYKYYLAQLIEPKLASILHIQPIAISGITMAGDNILCGRRSVNVTQYPGFYELAPSGGMDPVHAEQDVFNLGKQLMSELVEETGIIEKNVISIVPIAWVFDQQKESFEICMAIQIRPETMMEAFSSSLEYETLHWISKKGLKNQLHKNSWVPLSVYMINHFDLLQ